MTIQLSLNVPIKNLDGKEMSEGEQKITMAKALANALATGQGNPIKLYDLAIRFYSGAPVEVDETDFLLLRQVLEASNLIPLVKAPILREINAAYEAVKSAPRAA